MNHFRNTVSGFARRASGGTGGRGGTPSGLGVGAVIITGLGLVAVGISYSIVSGIYTY
jgi:hypothetical protein